MSETHSDNLKKLPTVGPQKETILNNEGYYSFEDLSKAHPLTLNQKSGIILASASDIIVSAIEELNGACPKCGSSTDLIPSWSTSRRINPPKDSSDLKCECGWDGVASQLESTEDQTSEPPVSTINTS